MWNGWAGSCATAVPTAWWTPSPSGGSFREKAEPLLADPRFHLCGASFVLNLQHVAGVEGRTALLDDGSRIFLPRAAAAAFKEAWGRFWLEGRGL